MSSEYFMLNRELNQMLDSLLYLQTGRAGGESVLFYIHFNHQFGVCKYI